MRNAAIITGALIVLVVGFVFATGSDDKADAPSKSPVATTTETVTTEATATSGSVATAAPAATPKPAATVPTVTFAGGKPKGGVQKLEFVKGDTVRFKVSSDVGEEVHVHGFDIKKDIAPGGSATFSFPARFDGKYEVEMENSATQIASLEIQP